jgi:hypothetical protein
MFQPLSERRTRSRRAFLGLALSLVGAASMLYYQFGLFMPRVERARAAKHLSGEYSFGDDFYPVWLTSREWIRARRDPYGPGLTRDIQLGLFGRPLDGQYLTDPPPDYRTFAYPAFTDLLLWPASVVPFRTFRIAWAILLASLLGVSVFLWTRALAWPMRMAPLAISILMVVCSYQELEGLYAGQLGLVVGFLLAAALIALLRDRLQTAGILMALTMIKPQMTILAILYLFLWCGHGWRSRRRFAVAFLSTMFLLIGASLVVWPHWIRSWVIVVLGYPRYATPPLASELLGPDVGLHAGTILIVVFLIGALGIAWRGRAAVPGSYQFWLNLSLVLSVTCIALLPGQSVCDHVILLPGILLLARVGKNGSGSRIFRALLLIGVSILLWPWVASFSLIVLRQGISPDVFNSKAVFVLPLRTAAPFPFVVLGLLALAARANRRKPAERIPATDTRG